MNLGKKLLEVRKAAGLSQVQLVSLLNNKGFDIKKYTISKWESGASNPTVEAFLAICDICGVEDIRGTFTEKRLLRLYDIPVSAGFGNYLEDSRYEMIEANDKIPRSADYAVKVFGDSMSPKFIDGQIIYIHKQDYIENGEIGIFCLNGEAYLKMLSDSSLVSLNKKYSPIHLDNNDELKIFGKVVI